MSTFLKHAPCPRCGSRDNLAVYEDNEHCFGCGYHKVFATGEVTVVEGFRLPELEDIDLGFRNISDNIRNKYKVGEYNDELYFPCFLNGVCIAAKTRNLSNWQAKEYKWKGNGQAVGLFGMQTCKQGGDIIITEGELDALAASLMYGMKASVVSITHGAMSAVNDLKLHWDWLNKYQTIYLCFDMDEPGREAVNKVLSSLPSSKMRVVNLPSPYKDACDVLKAADIDAFIDAIKSAQRVTPSEFMTPEEVISEGMEILSGKEMEIETSTGFKRLDKLVGGFRRGELITLVGGTGVGKTEFIRRLSLTAAEQSRKVLFFTLETAPRVVIGMIAEMILGCQIMSDPFTRRLVTEEQKKEAVTWISEHFIFIRHIGSFTRQKMIDSIEYAVIAEGISFVALDHLTAAVNTGSEYVVGEVDFTMAELNRITTQLNITTYVVTHQSRSKDDKEDAKTSLNRLRHSQGIAQNSHCVLGLERKREENILEVRTLKAHRIIGEYGVVTLTFSKKSRKYLELGIDEGEEYDAKSEEDRANETEKRISSNVKVQELNGIEPHQRRFT
jgi:twinkle protein